MSGFLGGCLANIADISRSITTMIGIQLVMDETSKSLVTAENRVEQSLADMRNIYVPIDAAKKMCEYLEGFHTNL